MLTFWAADSGKQVFELRDPDLINFRMDQSPDGTRLALFGQDKRGKPAPDATLRVYDMATRKPLWSKTIDDEYCYRHVVLYSADGNTFSRPRMSTSACGMRKPAMNSVVSNPVSATAE
ncbi:MAG TPA: hypothetical protein VHR66_09200 [Gemmataceae bacterium]|nr:hypothetical protein [Gemmataceae bacterium]